MHTCRTALLLILLLAPPWLRAQEWQQVSFPEDRFAVSVPWGWVEIPDEIMAAFSRYQQEHSTVAGRFAHGFQLASKPWLEFPRIFISLEYSGRIPLSSVTNLPKVMEQLTRQSRRLAKQDPSMLEVLKDTHWAKPLYDPRRHILWIADSPDASDPDTILGVTGIVMTSFGSINVHGYAPARSFREYLPVYERVIRSVEIDEAYRY